MMVHHGVNGDDDHVGDCTVVAPVHSVEVEVEQHTGADAAAGSETSVGVVEVDLVVVDQKEHHHLNHWTCCYEHHSNQ